MPSSYSQFGQDIHALHSVYKSKRGGYFVEVGAYDGIDSSNTLLMEKDYGWKGICVECSPSKYSLLQNNRTCITYPYAVYNEDNKYLDFFDSNGYGGLVETNNHAHIVNDRKLIVQTKKLTTILDEAGAPSFIEYISLDTEGSEYEILNAHDFTKYLFGYICVEHNRVEKNRMRIRALLESKGYRFCKENGNAKWGVIDDEYIHSSIDTPINVLFLNHGVKQCGVYQYGSRLFSILLQDKSIKYEYCEVGSLKEYNDILSRQAPYDLIIYNYHSSTMPWLNKDNIQKLTKNIGIPHESPTTMFDSLLSIDPADVNGIPRPLFNNVDTLVSTHTPSTLSIKEFIGFSREDVPIFGSFGFGFLNKGFDKMVRIINEQYDEAIIKLVIPMAAFDNNSKNNSNEIRRMCEDNNTKPGITLMITNEFFSNEDLLVFLHSNTMNMFLYDYMDGRGISSVLDYALSVKTPIGISDSFMFRRSYDDSICLYKNSVEDCKAASKDIHAKYSEIWNSSKINTVFKNSIYSSLVVDLKV